MCARGASELVDLVRPDDVVILHDPQTAGMARHLRAAGIEHVVWRAHIGVDTPNDLVRSAWDFLREDVNAAAAVVFSRERFVWEGLDGDPVVVIPPSIDVFSAKNQDLAPEVADSIVRVAGFVRDGRPTTATYHREDGSLARVDRRAEVLEEAPLEPGDRYVVQVSRWDRLKDPSGVLRGFVEHVPARDDTHLVLAGPASAQVDDDPDGPAVLAEVRAAWEALAPADRSRVHLASIPMEDAEENAAIVNALQARAAVVVQKSLAEGFGLTAAEAMWKRRPVVVSAVGGLQDQIVDGRTGLVVDPRDLAAFGAAVTRLLDDDELARRLGAAARERVREHFLEPRQLGHWVDLVELLVAVPVR